jgi:hypothetical protein
VGGAGEGVLRVQQVLHDTCSTTEGFVQDGSEQVSFLQTAAMPCSGTHRHECRLAKWQDMLACTQLQLATSLMLQCRLSPLSCHLAHAIHV